MIKKPIYEHVEYSMEDGNPNGMRKVVKQKWVEALRSGDYKQGKMQLHIVGKGKKKDQFCCLGVLCDIYQKQQTKNKKKKLFTHVSDGTNVNGDVVFYDNNDSFLPTEVIAWSGLGPEWQDKLSELNDDGYTFSDIAKYIETVL
jgi:hypothetical protein